MMWLKPVIEPAWPELGDENGSVRSDFLDPGQLTLRSPLEVDCHQLVVDVAPVRGQGGRVRGEQQGLDTIVPQG